MTDSHASSRKILISFALVLILGAAAMMLLTSASRTLEGGTVAPPFELPSLEDGRPVSLESLGGQVVLIDFWSTSCPPCVRQMAVLEDLHGRYGARGLAILGINTEGAPAPLLREFLRERGGASYRVLLEGERLSDLYRVTALPTLYLVDRQGTIRWSRTGLTGFDELERAIRPLLAERAPDASPGATD